MSSRVRAATALWTQPLQAVAAVAVAVAAWFSVLAVVGVLLLIIVATLFSLSHRDAAALAAVYVAVVAVVPATLQVPALGSVGTPQILLGVTLFGVWAVTWLAPSPPGPATLRPIPVLAAVFMASNLASYLAACLRPTDALERSAADRGMVLLVAALGACLLISEAVDGPERFEVVLKALVLAAVVIGAVGVVQFSTGLDPAAAIRLPGLRSAVDAGGFIGERSIFRRVAGTTVHAIEFSAVLCIAFPIALHLGLHAGRRWMAAAAVIAVALPMSVSRTAVLGLVAIFVVLIPGWDRRIRRFVYLGAAVYLVVMRLAVPGLLGTIRALFADAGVDPSVTSRQTDYDFVTRFVSERPLFGRGYATFVPTRYDFLDNQYLLSVVETGYLGAVVYVVLLLGGMLTARSIRRRALDERQRDLAQALTASLAVVLFTSVAFDFLSFPTARAMLFVVLGCVGCLWRLAPRRTVVRGPHDGDLVPSMVLAAARRRAAARLSLVRLDAAREHAVPRASFAGRGDGDAGAS